MIDLTTVSWIAEADVLCTELRANGIEAVIPDRGMVAILPFHSNAIGGIRIQVDESDLARAREILQHHLPPVSQGLFQCPACGSDSVHYERFSKRFAFLTLLLLGIPLLWTKRQCNCQACGHRWREE